MKLRNLWRDLGRFVPPNRLRLGVAAVTLGSLVSGLLEAAVLVLVVSSAIAVAEGESAAIDLPLNLSVELGGSTGVTIAAVLALLLVGVHVALARAVAQLGARLLRGARKAAIDSFVESSSARQVDDRQGALQDATSTLSVQSALLLVTFCTLLTGVAGLVVLLLTALIVNAAATGIVLVLGVLLTIVLRPIGRLTRSRSRTFVQSNSGFNESISSWSDLALENRIFGVEQSESRKLRMASYDVAVAYQSMKFMGRVGTDTYKDLAVLFLVGATWGLTNADNIDLSAVGSVVILIVRSLSYAQVANSSLQSMRELVPNLERLTERIDTLRSDRVDYGGTHLDEITSVEFRDASYWYSGDRPGVAGLDFSIAKGECIGIVGPSGGGKTTLLQVLLRLRVPTKGSVLVSGIPYTEIEETDWRRLTTLVPQEPKLFQGTIAENVRFHREVSNDRIRRACADAHILRDIERMPHGFDTVLGPRGLGLSGGQRQRIAIARALAGHPSLLVLDEPTSALDVDSERLFQQTLAELKGRVTMVIVAHRITTLASCDRVIAMAGSQIKRIGTLREAMEAVSLDASLVGDLAEE